MKARIYTKTGDKGETSLVGGSRVSKADPRLEAYGTLDELNSLVGFLRAHLTASKLSALGDVDVRLQAVQNNLFNIGSHLACEDEKLKSQLPGLTPGLENALEADMDRWESELPPLREFILPGGSLLASVAHQNRCVCRRAERFVIGLQQSGVIIDNAQIVFLNRLSDWFFLLARKCNSVSGINDVAWSKG